MSDEELLSEVRKLVERAGTARVLSALTGKGLAVSTADRIVSGRYSAKPRGLLRQVLLDMLNENKAS